MIQCGNGFSACESLAQALTGTHLSGVIHENSLKKWYLLAASNDSSEFAMLRNGQKCLWEENYEPV